MRHILWQNNFNIVRRVSLTLTSVLMTYHVSVRLIHSQYASHPERRARAVRRLYANHIDRICCSHIFTDDPHLVHYAFHYYCDIQSYILVVWATFKENMKVILIGREGKIYTDFSMRHILKVWTSFSVQYRCNINH